MDGIPPPEFFRATYRVVNVKNYRCVCVFAMPFRRPLSHKQEAHKYDAVLCESILIPVATNIIVALRTLVSVCAPGWTPWPLKLDGIEKIIRNKCGIDFVCFNI